MRRPAGGAVLYAMLLQARDPSPRFQLPTFGIWGSHQSTDE